MDDKTNLDKLIQEVSFREPQINLLYDLLIRPNEYVYPILHLYGLSGTGKTYLVKKFMNKFFLNLSNFNMLNEEIRNNCRYSIHIDCKEMCHSSVSYFLKEILSQLKCLLVKLQNYINTDQLDDDDDCVDDNESATTRTLDFSNFARQLKHLMNELSIETKQACLVITFDNAENLKNFKDANNFFLMLCKLNEHLNAEILKEENSQRKQIATSILFLTEMDWHSLISDCDVMSRTESPRPFLVFFNEYSKDQMKFILEKTANCLVSMQYYNSALNLKENDMDHLNNVQFYSRTILDVFFPICKDLNEIQYLIQIYYDQILNSTKSMSSTESNLKKRELSSYEKMTMVWNNMKPFLKQALTQIYLRNSIVNTNSQLKSEKSRTGDEQLLAKEFENLNIMSNNSNGFKKNNETTNQLPKIMKYLLISSYIATHNPPKYDKKLFEYNTLAKSRKSKFTAQKFQQTEDNQRAAAIKTQSFEINRLMAIFFAICAESSQFNSNMNLNLIFNNLKTLKSLHYLQQTNSSYSGIDEPKFKCLLDFETISNIATSVQFNMKQYLAEYLVI